MARKKMAEVAPTKFSREDRVFVNGFEIVRGDLIKVSGQYGVKFKFDSLVTNTETGSQWIDCFEMYRGASCQYRSFNIENVKRIPQKGKRAKRVV